MPSKTIIAVIGMHRSGTSAITRGLETMGVSLGDNLMEAKSDENEKGFWEDLDFYAINKRLLAKLGLDWDSAVAFSPDAFERAEFAEDRIAAVNLIETKLEACNLFAFKDPRTALTLPFWKSAFEDAGVQPAYVVCVRNPLEVAQSLLKRDQLDTAKSLLLWTRYMLACADGVADERHVFVSYEALLKDARSQLLRIAETLDLPKPDTELADSFASSFLDSRLRRHRIPTREVKRSDAMMEVSRQLYFALETAANDEGSGLLEIRQEVHAALQTADPILRLVDRLGKRAAALDADKTYLLAKRTEWADEKVALHEARNTLISEKSALNSEIEKLKQAVLKAEASIGEHKEAAERKAIKLTAELDAARAEHADIKDQIEKDADRKAAEAYAEIGRARDDANLARQELETVRQQHALLESSLEAAEADKAQVTGQIDDIKTEMANLRLRLEQQTRTIAADRAELAAEKQRARALLTEVRLSRAALNETRQSLSFRLTAPLRFAGRFLHSPRRTVADMFARFRGRVS